jgi:nucleotide-binding universal stress UspA family protein
MDILVPIDFSSVTEEVLGHAQVLSGAFSGKLWLLHVAAPDPDFVGYSAGPQSVRDQMAKIFHQEHQQLQGEAETLRESGIDATAVLAQGPTIETIMEEAERRKVDMIVLGSHGHGAVHQLLVGSVSEGVLHRATCPVLVVPAQKSA